MSDFLKNPILEYVPVGIAVLHMNMDVMQVNKKLCSMFKTSEEELQSHNFLELLYGEDQVYKQRFMDELLTRKVHYFIEKKIYTKTGTSLYCKGDFRIIYNEDQTQSKYILAILEDITSSIKTLNDLRTYRFGVEQSGNAILMTDIQGTITYVNRAFEQITGYSRLDIIGKNPRILKTENYSKEQYKQMWDTIRRGETWHGEFFNKRKDGTTYWEKNTISPVLDENGNFLHYIAIKEDISREKVYEEHLKKAKDAAIIANKLKSEFLANMSHEIRTPMNAIIGFTELLSEEVESPSSLEYLKIIKDSGKHLISLINDILDFSKIESGKVEINRVQFSPKKLFDKIYNIFVLKSKQKSIQYYLTIDNSVPDVLKGDDSRIQQIVINLVGNAFKFTQQGFIKIKVFYQAGKLTIKVIDTGIGIPKHKLNKIFRAFEQADASTTRQYGGTGLGLAITRKLISLMNGTIRVGSQEGKGTLFIVDLPLETVGEDEPIVIIDEEEISEIQDLGEHIIQKWFGEFLLYLGGDDMEMRKLFFETLASLEQIVTDFGTVIESANHTDIKREAHDIKGFTANLKITEISEIAAKIEEEISKDETSMNRIHGLYSLMKNIIGKMPNRYFTKPASADDKAAPGPQELSVLVAEDNKVNQKLMSRMLEKMGVNFEIAGDGLQALKKIEQNNYDLLLLDIQMPVMDGMEVLKKLKEAGMDEEIYIVALTANALKEDQKRYRNAGFHNFIPKPIEKEKLEVIINNLLEKKISPT